MLSFTNLPWPQLASLLVCQVHSRLQLYLEDLLQLSLSAKPPHSSINRTRLEMILRSSTEIFAIHPRRDTPQISSDTHYSVNGNYSYDTYNTDYEDPQSAKRRRPRLVYASVACLSAFLRAAIKAVLEPGVPMGPLKLEQLSLLKTREAVDRIGCNCNYLVVMGLEAKNLVRRPLTQEKSDN
jgi:hypothetical protein